LLTAWKALRHCASPEEAEAEAYLQGIRLVAEWIGKPTYAESVCLTLVRALQEYEDRSAWAGVIAEIKRVANLLSGCRFNHVRRDANMVAHMLANHALRSQDSAVMRYDMPSLVRSQVEVEAACNSVIFD
jgi:hypothetical protein